MFGSNAILCFLLCDVLVWTMHRSGGFKAVMDFLGRNEWTSLLYAVAGVMLIYLIVLPLYKRKIFIKL